MINELSIKLQELLTKDAKEFAKESNFVIRESKLSGEKFAKGLIFGWQGNPDSTLNGLKDSFETFNLKITEQGIDKRFSKESSKFMELLLNKGLSSLLNSRKEVSSDILNKFSDVRIYDSSTISLPVELIDDWRGVGGSNGGKSNSAIKLSVSMSLKNGSLKIVLEDGFIQDKNSELIVKDVIKEGSLIIRDLGYFGLNSFDEIEKQGAYYASRLKSQTKVYKTSDKEIDIIDLMKNKNFIDIDVFVGKQKQLHSRMIVIRLPEELKKERIEEILKDAKRENKKVSDRKINLSQFNIFITNIPTEILSFKDVLKLMISRWQIELLFKLWKNYCKIDESRSKKPYRRLTELYAKLLGAIISHQIIIIAMWENIDRSMFKSIKTIQSNVLLISYSLDKSISELIESIEFICNKLKTCKVNKRNKNPATFELLSGLKEIYYA
jgi:dephospho-CoA kinase